MMWMWPFVLVSWHVLNCQGQTIFPAIGYNPDLIPKLREDGTLDCRGAMQVNRKHDVCQFYTIWKTPVLPNMSGQLVESSYFQFKWNDSRTLLCRSWPRTPPFPWRRRRRRFWWSLGRMITTGTVSGEVRWVVMAGEVGSGDCIWVTYSLNDYLEDDWGSVKWVMMMIRFFLDLILCICVQIRTDGSRSVF